MISNFVASRLSSNVSSRVSSRLATAGAKRYTTAHAGEVRPAFTYKADSAAAAEYKKTYEDTVHHAVGTSKLWKNISIFVVVPVIVATAINTYYVEKAHADHRAHQVRLPDDESPPEYDYQNVRTVE